MSEMNVLMLYAIYKYCSNPAFAQLTKELVREEMRGIEVFISVTQMY